LIEIAANSRIEPTFTVGATEPIVISGPKLPFEPPSSNNCFRLKSVGCCSYFAEVLDANILYAWFVPTSVKNKYTPEMVDISGVFVFHQQQVFVYLSCFL